MKKIIVSESAGFCFGVSRSVRLAEETLANGQPCYCLGELIHNESVVEKLRKTGLIIIASPEDAPVGARVLVRSHGVSKRDYDALAARSCVIIDATCPDVKRIHGIVSEASAAGRVPVIIGADAHPEVEAIKGWCEGALVFADAVEFERWLDENDENRHFPLTIVFQTTQTEKNLEQIENLQKKQCTNCEVFDTICSATSTRQKRAAELSQKCDAMVVIGSKRSANSVHLAQIAAENCGSVQFISSADELDLSLLDKADTVGITAGASTPRWIIKEVNQTMDENIQIEETTAVPEAVETAPAQPETAEAAPVEAEAVETAPAEPEAIEAAPVAPEAVETAPAEPEAAEAAPAAPEAVEAAPAEPEAVEAAPAKEAEKSFDQMLEDSIKTIYNGETASCIVTAITPTEISVDLGIKYSGYIPVSEFADDDVDINTLVKIGDTVDASVVRVNDVEGTVMLSKKRLDALKTWVVVEEAAENGTILEGVVTEENKGGVVVSVKGIRVFVPASQTGLPREAEMSEILKQKVRLRIKEVNRARRRVVGSIRDVQRDERRERSEQVWNDIEVGKRYAGVVKSLTGYGAFVNIGGIDGMVHVSELSWSRIKQPSEVLAVGQEVEVYVISFDRDTRKISLGYKDPEGNPWARFMDNYKIGDVIDVKIVKLMPFGAFAEVFPGVDGLIHISQIADRRIGKPDEALTVGDTAQVKITAIDNDKQKISLSIRALLEPEKPETDEDGEAVKQPKPEIETDALVYEVSEAGEATGNLPEEAEEAPAEVAEKAAAEAPVEEAAEVAEEASAEVAEASEEAPVETAEEVSAEASEEAPVETAEEASSETSEETPAE